MLKKTLLGLFLLLCLSVAWFYIVGKGWLGSDWQSAGVASGPRPMQQPLQERPRDISLEQVVPLVSNGTPQIIFGDLHSHTNYSIDAYLFNTNLVKGGGIVTPADACDFARYCSALDFWSINDHAESLTPRVWADTVKTIQACNDNAGDPANPDMVSFVGWEWSNGNSDDVPSHYGHKNVVIRTWEEGKTPTRPIASKATYDISKVPSVVIGLMSLLLITSTTDAQEKQDPTAPSTVIEQTLSKIRDVEKLDTFVQQNATLVQENKKLKAEN